MELLGKVCLVTGASRGIGRGIALQLGQAGATVYITGRTLNPTNEGARGSLTETAKEVEDRGGTCIPVQCDHSNDDQVNKLFERITKEQHGRLDLLVNNAYESNIALMESFGKLFWELPSSMWDKSNTVGLRGYYVATWHAAKMMVPAKRGLIVNISSSCGMYYLFTVAYNVSKAGCDRMAVDCALELRKHNVACVSLWPGAVKTELLMDMLGSDTAGKNYESLVPSILEGESIEFTGKAILHLLRDPNIMKKSGRILITSDLAEEYKFTDIDGSLPTNYRRVKTMCQMSGHTWLAAFIPAFIKIPYWVMVLQANHF